ncbi:hypothetical protein [Phytohabitans aurantiacus]|nr:hypothetical protein [Phytohabitans aurantiacus]
MSMMRRGDEGYHYSDHSHRWIAPPGVDQEIWEAGVRAHLAQHMSTMGGPPARPEDMPECPPFRIPRAPRTRRTAQPAPRTARIPRQRAS